MKKVLMLGASLILLCTALTACGETKEIPEETTAENTMDFSELDGNYLILKDSYETVKNAYESSSVQADAEIENSISQAADVLNNIGELKKEDYASQGMMESANRDILNAQSALDSAAEKMQTSTASVSFEQIKENYDKMVAAYNTVSNIAAEKQSGETKAVLEEAKALISQIGEISPEKFKTQDEMINFNMIVCQVLAKLDAAAESVQ
ncbi:MAG: hypothetical protein IJR45_03655 [Firmicutes bacterium]|nr:hypothetical protein [Bacillota bacterium]